MAFDGVKLWDIQHRYPGSRWVCTYVDAMMLRKKELQGDPCRCLVVKPRCHAKFSDQVITPMRPVLKKLPKPIFPSLCRTTHIAAYYTQPSAAYFDFDRQSELAVSTTPKDISKEQRESLHNALRVDQAGEIAANWIYKGQLVVLSRDPTVGPLIQVRFYS